MRCNCHVQDAVANGKQASLGLHDGALPQGAQGHGGHNQGHAQDAAHMNYLNPVSFTLAAAGCTMHAEVACQHLQATRWVL